MDFETQQNTTEERKEISEEEKMEIRKILSKKSKKNAESQMQLWMAS